MKNGKPDVGIVMDDPAVRAIHFSRRDAARFAQLLDHAQQRFVQFAEVADLDGPVVDFGIAIQRPF